MATDPADPEPTPINLVSTDGVWAVENPGAAQPIGKAVGSDQRSQRGMREIITIWLIGLLCAVVGLAFTALFLDDQDALMNKRYEHLKSLLDVLVGPIVTLLSSVIGFYFGSQAAQQRNDTAGASGGTGEKS